MLLLWLNLICSLLLTGLIWTIQVVHYPLFIKVEKMNFIDYLKSHQIRISIIVIPLMIIELIAAILLGVYPTSSSVVICYMTLLLTIIIWISTFLLQVPLHQRLLNGYNKTAINKLVKTNWIRTIAWTVKSILLVYIFIY